MYWYFQRQTNIISIAHLRYTYTSGIKLRYSISFALFFGYLNVGFYAVIDGSFVNAKPIDSRAKRQAEHDLWEAVYYLWESGNITPQPTDDSQYQGEITYLGLAKIEAPKQIIFWSIVTTVREVLVFAVGTSIGLIAGSAGTLLLQSAFPLFRLASP
jgi:hypothetical protein